MVKLSLVEENYLKAIYHLSGHGQENVSTNAIALQIQTTPASVSDMVRKLAKKKVVEYTKYQGVNLTNEGTKMALRIIRKHRLWEVFLVKELKFHWDQVHDVAEQLEHIQSPLLIQRLDEYLGFPKFDPHGDPIPNEHGEIEEKPKLTLSSLKECESGIIAAVKDTSAEFLKYMDKIGVYLGAQVTVMDIEQFDRSQEIEIDGAKRIFVSKQVSENILITQ